MAPLVSYPLGSNVLRKAVSNCAVVHRLRLRCNGVCGSVLLSVRVAFFQVDPSGKRTIGVLTKPDLINPGGEAEVLEVLSNNRKPLKLGYVMVKVHSTTFVMLQNIARWLSFQS